MQHFRQVGDVSVFAVVDLQVPKIQAGRNESMDELFCREVSDFFSSATRMHERRLTHGRDAFVKIHPPVRNSAKIAGIRA